MKVQSLGHVVLRVKSLERAVPFYRDVLGLTEVGRLRGEMVFFSIAGNHHDIALAEVGEHAPDAAANAPGLAHLALKVGDDLTVLRDAREHLLSHGVNIIRQRDHVVSQSLYFNDVDGNRLELFVDADPAIWRADRGKVANSVPLEL